MNTYDPAWLPDEAWHALRGRRALVLADGGPIADTLGGELHEGSDPDLVLALRHHADTSDAARAAVRRAPADLGPEGYAVTTHGHTTVVLAESEHGLLYGLFDLLRADPPADGGIRLERPHTALRKLDHWDNLSVHPRMGQVERGYAGGSLFWDDGRARNTPEELRRLHDYGRLLASCGINAITVNNVNVHEDAAHLLTDRLDDVVTIADALRPWGIRVHLSVSYAAPVLLGGLPTADPLAPDVRAWWQRTTEAVYEAIDDFGGYTVKADSEGQPGPHSYGRDHAQGANLLAAALAPHGGVVHWRAFVYDHRQDWRDRSTDRARAAYDEFTPLDEQFDANVILQVKHGPIDFQPREPVSPLLAAMPRTRLAIEVQATQEYTGQQQHVCYLAPMWSEVLGFRPYGEDDARTIADLGASGGFAAVANTGNSPFWCGHPLAQANLYAYGRLAWNPALDPDTVLAEWTHLTHPGAPDLVRTTVRSALEGSWRTYEKYTAPLGVGFMVRPHHHYGPDVDGYEYTPWGTYHHADRDGVGVDRTTVTGTGYSGQYPEPWSDLYDSPGTCPDELLLFFHHVPYTHRLHSGRTVIQHIYDTHAEGCAEAEEARRRWQRIAHLLPGERHRETASRYEEQVRCAREWRDQINAYFHRKSGIPDERGAERRECGT
ncbi:alpha-glucuronidase family glycosyl hydrolase [Streptomyces endophyticus]|uniref:Alpha-glucuronidase n=1 Tax=Streptomyces endophyticus TaxID=714166 RepID=A0ABU6F2I8_9ACTN|nr:alpha-glucuronidase family glycosyl hydrolase [Streptomyces endophyticus]MEB8338227.1 alpha-glucuronidase [Streptomyces endophyticus]